MIDQNSRSYTSTPTIQVFEDFIELTKPKLTLLTLLTATVGFLMAPPPINLYQAVWGLPLILFVIMGATSLNCYLEKDIDALMDRTKNRALPAKKISHKSALIFSLLLLGISLPLISLTINLLTGFFAAMAAIIYLFAYTPLKQITPFAVYVGAIPGAIPPVLGWTVATGHFSLLPLSLFIILFIWQIPHFLAISIYHVQDYRRASMPVYGDKWSHKKIAWVIPLLTLLLAAASFWPMYLENVAPLYYSLVSALNGLFIAISCGAFWFIHNTKGLKEWARAYFLASIIYLPLLLGIMIIANKF